MRKEFWISHAAIEESNGVAIGDQGIHHGWPQEKRASQDQDFGGRFAQAASRDEHTDAANSSAERFTKLLRSTVFAPPGWNRRPEARQVSSDKSQV